jgi:hypothetical protein
VAYTGALFAVLFVLGLYLFIPLAIVVSRLRHLRHRRVLNGGTERGTQMVEELRGAANRERNW